MQTVHLFDCIIISVNDGKSAAAFIVVNSNTEQNTKQNQTKPKRREERKPSRWYRLRWAKVISCFDERQDATKVVHFNFILKMYHVVSNKKMRGKQRRFAEGKERLRERIHCFLSIQTMIQVSVVDAAEHQTRVRCFSAFSIFHWLCRTSSTRNHYAWLPCDITWCCSPSIFFPLLKPVFPCDGFILCLLRACAFFLRFLFLYFAANTKWIPCTGLNWHKVLEIAQSRHWVVAQDDNVCSFDGKSCKLTTIKS